MKTVIHSKGGAVLTNDSADLSNPELKAKSYACWFLEAGVVRYENEMVLIRAENVHKIAETFKGLPVIIDHENITLQNVDEEKVGLVADKIWRDENARSNCSFLVDNKNGVNVINQGYSVSCAYIPTKFGEGGTWHNVPYDREILDGVGVHLALVANPRYEDAMIIENSKKETKKMFKIFKNKKEEVTVENAIIEVDGEEVTLENAIDAFRARKEAEKRNAKTKMNAEDEMEVDGEKVKVGDLMKAYKASKAKKNESAEEESEEDTKDNADEASEEADKQKALEKKEKEEKIKENAVFQTTLKAAREKALQEDPLKNASTSKVSTKYERQALGKALYGKRN